MTRDEALALAAQAWCEPSTSHLVMEGDLARAFADILHREVEAAERLATFPAEAGECPRCAVGLGHEGYPCPARGPLW